MKLRPREPDQLDVFLSLMHADLNVFAEWGFGVLAGQDAPYLPNWHIEAMNHHLTLCAQGQITRLLITVPPRYLKSHCASICFPGWVLDRKPAAKLMCVSYGDKPTLEFAANTRSLMRTEDYRRAFPHTVLADSAVDMLRTSAGGQRMATSVTGAATGFGCDYLIIDDLTKAGATSAERLKAIEAFQTQFLSRLNDKKTGVVIVVAQRTHIDDLPGFLLAQSGWVHLDLPAIASKDALVDIGQPRRLLRKSGHILHPAREDAETLTKIRQDLGEAVFAAQYLNKPGAPQGAAFRAKWFPRYAEPYWLGRYEHRVFVIDTAFTAATTSDYSVCAVYGVWGENTHLLDVWRERVDFDDLTKRVHAMIDSYKPTHIFVEMSANGVPLYQQLRKKYERGVHAIGSNLSKQDRAARVIAYLQSGKIMFPQKAPWLATWENETFSFPSSVYDDQVDTLIYFAAEAQRGFDRRSQIEWFRRPPPGRLFSYSQ
jgi:predicted phage terminase large subunit-like protein